LFELFVEDVGSDLIIAKTTSASSRSNESLIKFGHKRIMEKQHRGEKMDGLVLALTLQMEDDELLEEIYVKQEKA